MMYTVSLPALAGSRPAAAELLSGLPADLSGSEIAVLCRDLLTGSPSFADELVRQLAVERSAGRVLLVGADETFERYVRDAARSHAVAERVATRGGHAAAQ
jgi:hypothetical protein